MPCGGCHARTAFVYQADGLRAFLHRNQGQKLTDREGLLREVLGPQDFKCQNSA